MLKFIPNLSNKSLLFNKHLEFQSRNFSNDKEPVWRVHLQEHLKDKGKGGVIPSVQQHSYMIP